MMSIHEGRLEEGSEETGSTMAGLGIFCLQGVVKFPKDWQLLMEHSEQCFEELDLSSST